MSLIDFQKETAVVMILSRTLAWNKHQEPEHEIKDWLPFPKKLKLPFQVKEDTLNLGRNVACPDLAPSSATLILSQNLNERELAIQGLQGNQNFETEPISLSAKSGKLELHFHWSYFHVGDPERSEMKIGELEAGKSIEFRVNGKRDFTLTGRRDRSYLEQSFWIQHLGNIRQVAQSKAEDFPFELTNPDKLVDLRKLLW